MPTGFMCSSNEGEKDHCRVSFPNCRDDMSPNVQREAVLFTHFAVAHMWQGTRLPSINYTKCAAIPKQMLSVKK